MALWDDAPVTRAAFGPTPPTFPRPIEKEWGDLATDDQDFVAYIGGTLRRGREHWGWGHVAWGIAADQQHLREPCRVRQTPASSIERVLSPLAHEARVRLMQALFDGPKSPEELSEATGLRGGALHEHLNELIDATYVTKAKGAYDLTLLGGMILLTVSLLARKIVKDAGDE